MIQLSLRRRVLSTSPSFLQELLERAQSAQPRSSLIPEKFLTVEHHPEWTSMERERRESWLAKNRTEHSTCEASSISDVRPDNIDGLPMAPTQKTSFEEMLESRIRNDLGYGNDRLAAAASRAAIHPLAAEVRTVDISSLKQVQQGVLLQAKYTADASFSSLIRRMMPVFEGQATGLTPRSASPKSYKASSSILKLEDKDVSLIETEYLKAILESIEGRHIGASDRTSITSQLRKAYGKKPAPGCTVLSIVEDEGQNFDMEKLDTATKLMLVVDKSRQRKAKILFLLKEHMGIDDSVCKPGKSRSPFWTAVTKQMAASGEPDGNERQWRNLWLSVLRQGASASLSDKISSALLVSE